ncbi:hypothetical protein CRM22_008008 [Opisthorchis felineus]|uniref:HD domain-containing protein n=1 Tax=Opisthorchis felineus TaxID=147828 RepID=A0A4S2LK81_OPIFE|nr:hypothetical protein CRM22_008008 [Opisthorchis felineus]
MGALKIVQDAVHGMIELEPLARLIVDTPEFQRLREVRQLGLSYFVFPSCQHTRFEHSIGTYHMAKRLTEAIQSDPIYTGPKMTSQEQAAVKIAALCHDLGHGPFSHLWETFVKRGGPKYSKYKHEKLSCRVLEHIVQTNPMIQSKLESEGIDLDLVKCLIMGTPQKRAEESSVEKPYLYEILSNHANGMDVDKWDYLLRDCLHAGLGHGSATIDLERFMHFCRPAPHPRAEYDDVMFGTRTVVDDPDKPSYSWHLSFRDTELENVLRTFGLRQHLHQKLYQHKTASAISCMVLDMLEFIEPVLQFRSLSLKALEGNDTGDLVNFLQLHDHILWDVYNRRFHTPTGPVSESLEQARSLVDRILRRQLYSYVDSVFEVHSRESKTPSRRSSVSEHHHPSTFQSGMGIREPLISEPLPPDCRIVGRLSFEQRFPIVPSSCILTSTMKQPLDTAGAILDEVFARLPENSPIRDKQELLIEKASFSSNSTPHAPEFYFYTRTGKTFIYDEPLRVVHAYRLYWRGRATVELDIPRSDISEAIQALATAFDLWHREKVGDRYNRTIT